MEETDDFRGDQSQRAAAWRPDSPPSCQLKSPPQDRVKLQWFLVNLSSPHTPSSLSTTFNLLTHTQITELTVFAASLWF